MADCLFCKIAKKEISATIVLEDDDIVVFRDIHPRAPVHMLIVPRLHVASVNDLERHHEAVLGRLFSVAKTVAEKLGVAASGYRLVVNTGPDSGQVVDHLHMHLLGGRMLGPKGQGL